MNTVQSNYAISPKRKWKNYKTMRKIKVTKKIKKTATMK